MRICLIILFCLPLLAQAQSRLDDSKAELTRLKSRIGEITRQLDADRAAQDALSQAIETIEKRLSALQRAAALAAQDARLAQQKVDQLERERKQLQSRLNEHYHGLQSHLRAAQVIGRQARTRMLLSQQDPGRLARMQRYMHYFQQHYQQRITAFTKTLDELEIKNRQSASALAELKALQTSREQALAAIQTQRKSRQRKLDEVQKRLGAGGAQLAALRAQQAQLEKLIDQLNQALRESQLPPLSGPFTRHKGQLYRPVPGKTLASYNSRKPDGESRWKGLWLAADNGDPVRAVAPGRVVYVGWMHHYGLLLVLDHADGWFSLYGHNQSVNRAVGESVSAGDVIAAAGNTGGHDTHGVYLEIRKGRDTHNPARWLRPQDG